MISRNHVVHLATSRRMQPTVRHQRIVPHAAAAAAATDAVPVVEMKDVMDASLGAIDRTIYDYLKLHAPVSWHLSSFSVRCMIPRSAAHTARRISFMPICVSCPCL